MNLMFNIRSIPNGNPFENDLDDEIPSNCSSASGKRTRPFIRIPILISCTIIVFILLIAGTATTAISYPPQPPQWKYKDNSPVFETALDGDYKLIGPLLLTSGIFLLIVDVILCVIVTKDAYIASRSIQPTNVNEIPKSGPLNLLGGPFYLASPNPTVSNPNAMVPFAFSRQLWTMPNAPTPDFAIEDTLKDSKIRATTATIERCSQPPYNPDAKEKDDT